MADLPLDRHLGAPDTAEAIESYAEIDIPASLRDKLALFLRLERTVLKEYDPAVCDLFDRLLNSVTKANEGNPGAAAAEEPADNQGIPTADTAGAQAFRQAVALIDELPVDQAQVVVRAFGTFFHLANLSEESYRVEVLRELELGVSMDDRVDASNELVVAYDRLMGEVGPSRAAELLGRLEFRPVFTAHPTEARRKAVEGKIRRIAALLEEHPRLGGSGPHGKRAAHAAGDRRARAHLAHRAPKAHAARRGRHHHRHLRQHAVQRGAAGVPPLR